MEGWGMNKILIAIDGSDNSLKATDYVARQLSGTAGLQVTLFHVLPYVPAVFWDDGHILSKEEREARKKVVDKWLTNRQSVIEPVFEKAIALLLAHGIKTEQIETKIKSDSIDVAGSILEEAHDGRYHTLVMGRRGISPAKQMLMGSVTTGVINHGTGMAICIVE